MAQNLKGGENPIVSASPVRSVVGVQPPTPITTPATSVEDELRTRLSASQLRIVQLAAEVHRLNLKVSIKYIINIIFQLPYTILYRTCTDLQAQGINFTVC